MSRRLTAADRSALIRLASALPAGDETRRAILAGLGRVATEFPTQEALDKYLKDHPGADKSKHTVKGKGGDKAQQKQVPRTKEDLLKFMYDIDWKKSWRKSNSERAERKKVVQAVADDAIKKFYDNPKMKSIVSQSFKDYDDGTDLRIDIRDQVLAGVGLDSERLNDDDLDTIIERITDDVEKIVLNYG